MIYHTYIHIHIFSLYLVPAQRFKNPRDSLMIGVCTLLSPLLLPNPTLEVCWGSHEGASAVPSSSVGRTFPTSITQIPRPPQPQNCPELLPPHVCSDKTQSSFSPNVRNHSFSSIYEKVWILVLSASTDDLQTQGGYFSHRCLISHFENWNFSINCY